jgi:hypothetical protein
MSNDYFSAYEKYLVDNWKLDSSFAKSAAKVLAYCVYYNLHPQITSGYRNKEQQADLVARWKAGDPNVTTPMPPGKSLHNNTTWWGSPAALAMDMVVSNFAYAGWIAHYFRLSWAARDPVHFALRGGEL